MAGSSSLASPRSLQLPLLLLFLLVAAAIGSYDPKAFCSKTTDVASCLKVFPTLPDIVTKAQDNQELYKRLVRYCSFKTYEATSLAESMIATTTAANPANIATFFEQWKGDEAITTKTPPGKCLLSCNKTIGEVNAILTCGHTYMEDRPPIIHQNLTDNKELYKRLVRYCSFKTYEARSLAESMIATTTAANPANIATLFEQWKGDEAITAKTPPGKCLLSCNKTIGDPNLRTHLHGRQAPHHPPEPHRLAASSWRARQPLLVPAISASTTRGGLRQCGQDRVTDHEQTSNDEPTRIHDNGGKTVEYLEYGNWGAGAETADRVKWKGVRVITAAEANRFTVDHFINGNQWVPNLVNGEQINYTHGLI
uniref:Pectinesterase catalytic domain-containing protein n=1 Tax=Oryza rufipogon TaxID=4529 RepID=A0A0E0R574_ORYRU